MRTVAGTAWETLSQREQHRLALRDVLRSFAVALGIVVAYFVVPMTGANGLRNLVLVLGGLAGVSLLIAWQVRGILRSPHPAATAVGGLAVSVPLFLLVFATVYYVMGAEHPASWSEPLTKLDAVYYAVTVFTTVGFGDITATSQAARAAVTLQMVGGLVLVGVIARVVVAAVKESRRRQGKG